MQLLYHYAGMYCTHLEKLDLSGISVTQSSFRQLSQRCTNITVSSTQPADAHKLMSLFLQWLKVNGCHTVGEKWYSIHICIYSSRSSQCGARGCSFNGFVSLQCLVGTAQLEAVTVFGCQ